MTSDDQPDSTKPMPQDPDAQRQWQSQSQSPEPPAADPTTDPNASPANPTPGYAVPDYPYGGSAPEQATQPPYGQSAPDQPPYGQAPPYGQPTYDAPGYGQPSGQPGATPAYGQPASQPVYGQPASQPVYGQPASQPVYGQPAYGQPAYGQAYGPTPYGVDPFGRPYSDKSKVMAGVLQILFGWLGAGRFYTGHTGMAFAQLVVSFVTCGLGAIWGLIDGIVMLTGNPSDAQGRPLRP